jgi:hypothetical protein
MARRVLLLGAILGLLLPHPLRPRASAAERESDPEVAPRRVTLKDKAISLAEALRRLKAQTGIEVVDRRRQKTNPTLDLALADTPFWPALDGIAQKAKVVVDLYQDDGRIALVDGTYRPLPVSYSGVFRTVLKRLTLTQDLEAGTRFGVAYLEVAWEPRFQPFFLDQQAASVSYRDPNGKAQSSGQKGKGQLDVHGRISQEFTVVFPAPDRAVKRLDLIKGSMSLLTPRNMLTFTFDKLAPIGAKKGKPQVLKKEGVTVRLTKFLPDDDPIDVEVVLDYPRDEIRFQSHQSWLVNNEIVLVKKGARPVRHLPTGSREGARTVYPHAEILYYFANKGGKLGKPQDLKLVYRTPGRIVSLPMQFEFKDVPLP